ncbi:MAG: T9SS type A sorting domain-containing protein [Bacteroidales bacterium]|nr:T9SS type A sorting domain-containing protein [Bacteroidales bacterium]
MMIRNLLLLFLLIFSGVLSKGQFTYFNNHYNNDNWSAGISIVETESGYVAFGVSGVESGQYIFKRILLTGIDHQGNQLWWKTYGEDFHNYYAGLNRGGIKTSDGGFAVSGAIEDEIRVVGLLMKFDENGDSLWSRIYGDTISPGYSFHGFYACQQLPDQGYLMVGAVYVSGDDSDILLIRTDSLGNQIWIKTYGELHFMELAYSLSLLPDGEFLIGYMSQNINVFYTMHPGMLKIDNQGNEIWSKIYSGPYDDSGCAVTISQDGNYLLGSSYGYISTHPVITTCKVWIIKTDTSGNIIWDKIYGDKTYEGLAMTINEMNDGSIIVSGSGGFEFTPGIEGWILKTESDGDSLWMRRYSHFQTYDNEQNDLAFTTDNGLVLTGMTMGYPDWIESVWVQKLDSIGCDSVGCDTTVGIFEGHGGLGAWGQGGVELYPNPASDLIHITFRQNNLNRFPARDRELEIFNVYGEKVVGMKLSIFQESITQNISGLAQGLYLVVIRERQKVVCTGKFLIAR